MDKNYWEEKWQARDIGFNQQQPNKLMQRYFPSLNLAPGSRIFVPLCGQSVDMLWLSEQDYLVIGVEYSQMACDAFFEENKIPCRIVEVDNFTVYSSGTITLLSGDFFEIKPSVIGSIDAVYDRAALIALTAELRQAYARHLTELMRPETKMLLITTSYKQDEMRGPPFSVDEQEVTELYSACFDINQLYNKPFDVPSHLQNRGLRQGAEQVYSLTKNK
ncbi:thiopurine S-methyltransferase [Legionella quinlivanii]|uniref:Thiopurine S-methyltransferase n=1 Tax=Legionella quinlivanii TaxID=45073 RepID=A0A364LNQ8_9GAMM|nr:thiopurine S-methyltransferase [Legionella quinlivanii]RAP38470.1 thiopurine S-methyltransferase [Legionella quinlivanii]